MRCGKCGYWQTDHVQLGDKLKCPVCQCGAAVGEHVPVMEPPSPSAPAPLRVLVTGSRTWDDSALVGAALDQLLWTVGSMVVVHGACPKGADLWADYWCAARGVAVERHPADWSTGKGAGFARNAAMVAAGADVCLAFIKDDSAGASHCARSAEEAGITVLRNEETRGGFLLRLAPVARETVQRCPEKPRSDAGVLPKLRHGEFAEPEHVPTKQWHGMTVPLAGAELEAYRAALEGHREEGPPQVTARAPQGQAETPGGKSGKQMVALGVAALERGWFAEAWYWRSSAAVEGAALALGFAGRRAVACWSRPAGRVGSMTGWKAEEAFIWGPGQSLKKITHKQLGEWINA